MVCAVSHEGPVNISVSVLHIITLLLYSQTADYCKPLNSPDITGGGDYLSVCLVQVLFAGGGAVVLI